MKVLENLNHPNVTTVVEIIDNQLFQYIVTEYCALGNLKDYMFRKQGFFEPQLKSIVKQLLEGLNALHSRGICHRNIKPDNILVSSESVSGNIGIQITNFEYATSMQECCPTLKMTLGTRLFMSPELIRKSGDFDTKVDIWAVGVTAFYLLTYGQYPYPGITRETVDDKIKNSEPELYILGD